MTKLRKFRALITEMGYDDIGMSGMVFETEAFIKGKIYTEADRNKYSGGYSQKPFIVDHTACTRYIDDLLKDGIMEELEETVSTPKIERNNEAERLLDHFYFGDGIANFVFDRDYIQSAQGYAVFLGIMHDYAKLCIDASLKEAAKNALMETKGGWYDSLSKHVSYSIVDHGSYTDCEVSINEDSIINIKNHKYV